MRPVLDSAVDQIDAANRTPATKAKMAERILRAASDGITDPMTLTAIAIEDGRHAADELANSRPYVGSLSRVSKSSTRFLGPVRLEPAPRAEAVSLGTSRHETASFAPIASLRNEEASHGALAKIIFTNVSIQFLCRLDDWRFDVSRGARVYRPAHARITVASIGGAAVGGAPQNWCSARGAQAV